MEKKKIGTRIKIQERLLENRQGEIKPREKCEEGEKSISEPGTRAPNTIRDKGT